MPRKLHRTSRARRDKLWQQRRKHWQTTHSALGRAREEMVYDVVHCAVTQGLIRSAGLTRESSKEDMKGVDIFFWTYRNEKYVLQVKSNEDDAREFKETHPSIPVVVALSCSDTQSVLKQLKQLFPCLRALKLPGIPHGHERELDPP